LPRDIHDNLGESRGVAIAMRDPAFTHHYHLTRQRLDRVRRYRKEVRCVLDCRWYPSHRETTAVLRRCSPFGRREFWLGGGGRASARLPCWLNIRIARIGRGFHGLSNGCVAPRSRGNPWDARGSAARGGLPTVVRYGTPGFPETAKSWPANRDNLFAGGAGGTAKQAKPVLDYRQAAGPVPAPAPLMPPAADVPGYQHVFLFYFENEDYSQVIGITSRSPAAARSASRSPTPKRKTRSITSTPRTSGTSSPAAANRGRHTCRARTARATTPCTAITGTTTSR
jgi:hypothetical protein